ncbi:phenylalanine--tRNA ligase alpha subunit-like [Oscarella lobularis]|uniref:phenylalanine--tRNA ligase alpha subunit-like n=1 Tax=Oscarella lobularis TaxID=121494 RepID=UPI0033144D7F
MEEAAQESLHQKILRVVAERGSASSAVLAKDFGCDHQTVVGAIKSLQSLKDVVDVEKRQAEVWLLTSEGKDVAQNGSHEATVYGAVNPDEGTSQAELEEILSKTIAELGMRQAIAKKWLEVRKTAAGEKRVFRKVTEIKDDVKTLLQKIEEQKWQDIEKGQLKDLQRRKLLSKGVSNTFLVSKGSAFTTQIEKPEAELTAEMIASGSWKGKTFKPYNFSAKGLYPKSGHLHPLMKVRSEFRQIFLEMGFTEMPTNNFVESSFWNFDALFQPQQHPARDAHDTFFMKDPKYAAEIPDEYAEKVKLVHEGDCYGSTGYQYDWKFEEAKKNILRTHTTAVSARMLYKLSQQETFSPVKYFSVDRVFRNEALDATHLAEFHQIEGFIADYDLTLANLIGILYEFFKKLGMTNLKFKPTYNPYTEPSMEVFSYHDEMKKWIEVGNSGVFRPEMLLPMGLPENVSVIAWGLSLERPTMIKYGISNIRDLFGHKVDLQMVHDNPLCRLDK